MILLKRFLSCLLAVCLVSGVFSISASAASVPKITWCSLEQLDTQAVLHFETPETLLQQIDGYELRTETTDWFPVADSAGGSLSLPEGGYVYLRCFKDGVYSEVWSAYAQFGEAYIIADNISGASVAYRASSRFPQNAYLSADRITSGSVYESVQQAVQASKYFELYDIYFLYADGLTFAPGNAAIIRLPLGENLKRGHCRVYYVDEVGKRMMVVDESYDRTSVTFRSRGAGLYFVTDEWDGVSEIRAAAVHAIGAGFDFYGKKLICGDADGDSVVTAADARMVLRGAVGLDNLSLVQQECADVDADLSITSADARAVLRYSVGLP